MLGALRLVVDVVFGWWMSCMHTNVLITWGWNVCCVLEYVCWMGMWLLGLDAWLVG